MDTRTMTVRKYSEWTDDQRMYRDRDVEIDGERYEVYFALAPLDIPKFVVVGHEEHNVTRDVAMPFGPMREHGLHEYALRPRREDEQNEENR